MGAGALRHFGRKRILSHEDGQALIIRIQKRKPNSDVRLLYDKLTMHAL